MTTKLLNLYLPQSLNQSLKDFTAIDKISLKDEIVKTLETFLYSDLYHFKHLEGSKYSPMFVFFGIPTDTKKITSQIAIDETELQELKFWALTQNLPLNDFIIRVLETVSADRFEQEFEEELQELQEDYNQEEQI